MPWGLKRFQNTGQSHFVTFSCYHHQPLLMNEASRRLFESALERVRRSFQLRVYGYVVMPDHIHLLVSEPHLQTLADALKSLKQGVSRRLIADQSEARTYQNTNGGPYQNAKGGPYHKANGGRFKPDVGLSGHKAEHFWQKRYYDFNVRNQEQFVEKLRYIHRNPVNAGLCERPEDWQWSSFLHYATGCEGRVEIESEWTARKRERAEGKLCAAVELPHSSQRQA
jgi:putative transposase